jgi:hypothetical protein
MITIRLTAEEYQRLHDASVSSGFHSVADFARTAIHALLDHHREAPPAGAVPLDPLEARFSAIHARICSLEERLQSLQSLPASQPKVLHAGS